MSCEAFFFSPPIVAREGFLALNVSVLSQAALDTELSPPVGSLQEKVQLGGPGLEASVSPGVGGDFGSSSGQGLECLGRSLGKEEGFDLPLRRRPSLSQLAMSAGRNKYEAFAQRANASLP